jgi:hypothetical protein
MTFKRSLSVCIYKKKNYVKKNIELKIGISYAVIIHAHTIQICNLRAGYETVRLVVNSILFVFS